MNYTLHIQDGEQFVKERQFKTDPSNDRWPDDADSISLMHQRIDEYNAHLASLKSFPLIGKTDKKHGDEMREGVDFRFQHQQMKLVYGGENTWHNITPSYYKKITTGKRIICLSIHNEEKKDLKPGTREETQEWLRQFDNVTEAATAYGKMYAPRFKDPSAALILAATFELAAVNWPESRKPRKQ